MVSAIRGILATLGVMIALAAFAVGGPVHASDPAAVHPVVVMKAAPVIRVTPRTPERPCGGRPGSALCPTVVSCLIACGGLPPSGPVVPPPSLGMGGAPVFVDALTRGITSPPDLPPPRPA